MPCPQSINIPAVLRFHDFYVVFGLKEWARKLYGGLEMKADRCIDCGLCEAKCPRHLPIAAKLKSAHSEFFG
jgi:predicted aldo/keto reductase-like oxidoreductase